MLTTGGLVKLKGLIDELTKTADDVLMFVDSPAVLPKAPVAKPIDKPENKPEEKPEPKEKPKPNPTGILVKDHPDDDCKVYAVRRKSENTKSILHNTVADALPGNVTVGKDAFLWGHYKHHPNGKNFDALTEPNHTLWEVKTDAYGEYKKSPKTAWLVKLYDDKRFEEYASEAADEWEMAMSCGYDYCFGTTDAAFLEQMQKRLGSSIKTTLLSIP